MSARPKTIKLRCQTWQQLRTIYDRDLQRGTLFLRAGTPPEIGTALRIELTLPSNSQVILAGTVDRHISGDETDDLGAGIDVCLNGIPQTAMWMMETALRAAEDGSAPGATAASPDGPVSDEPSLEDGEEIVAATSDLMKSLWEELEVMPKVNAFQVLGLDYNATDDDVRRAFGELTKRYHPDRFARYECEELKHLSSEIFILLRNAYRQLVNLESREAALQKIALESAQPIGEPAQRRRRSDLADETTPLPEPQPEPVDSSSPAAVAAALIDAGEYSQAIAQLRIETRKDRNNVEIQATLELAEGLKAFEANDRMEAAQRFERVLELDPGNERATRGLADIKRNVVNQRRGMLTKLMRSD